MLRVALACCSRFGQRGPMQSELQRWWTAMGACRRSGSLDDGIRGDSARGCVVRYTTPGQERRGKMADVVPDRAARSLWQRPRGSHARAASNGGLDRTDECRVKVAEAINRRKFVTCQKARTKERIERKVLTPSARMGRTSLSRPTATSRNQPCATARARDVTVPK